MTPYETESLRLFWLMNSATKVLQLKNRRVLGFGLGFRATLTTKGIDPIHYS